MAAAPAEPLLAYVSASSLHKRQRVDAVADCALQRNQPEEDLFLLQKEGAIPIVCLKPDQLSPRDQEKGRLQQSARLAQQEAQASMQQKSESDQQLQTSLAALELIQGQVAHLVTQDKTREKEVKFLLEQDKKKDAQLKEASKENDDMLALLSDGFAAMAPRMLRDYGRSLAAKELLAEMDQQDIDYRLKNQLPPPLHQTEAEIENELRISAGTDWEQTAKQIRAVERRADGTQVPCFPRTAGRWTEDLMRYLDIASNDSMMKKGSQFIHGSTTVMASQKVRQFLLAESRARVTESGLQSALEGVHALVFE